MYEWSLSDFTGTTYDTPDTPIPVSSINMLIFKHQDIDQQECLGLEDLMLHEDPLAAAKSRSKTTFKRKREAKDESVHVIDLTGEERVKKAKRTRREAVHTLDWTHL